MASSRSSRAKFALEGVVALEAFGLVAWRALTRWRLPWAELGPPVRSELAHRPVVRSAALTRRPIQRAPFMRLSVLAIRPPDMRYAAVKRRYFQAAPEPPVLPQPTRGYLVKRIHKSYYLPDCVYLDCAYLDCVYSNCVGSNCIDVQKSRYVLIHEFGSRVQPVDLSADSIRRLRSWRHGPFASSAC